jgi:hypothetical protein
MPLPMTRQNKLTFIIQLENRPDVISNLFIPPLFRNINDYDLKSSILAGIVDLLLSGRMLSLVRYH